MKICVAQQSMRKMLLKTTTGFSMAIEKTERTNCWQGCEKKGPLYISGGTVNLHSHYKETHKEVPQKIFKLARHSGAHL